MRTFEKTLFTFMRTRKNWSQNCICSKWYCEPITRNDKRYSLRKKCPYLELFWSAFSRILTEYLLRMRENADQNNSEYGHFSRSDCHQYYKQTNKQTNKQIKNQTGEVYANIMNLSYPASKKWNNFYQVAS